MLLYTHLAATILAIIMFLPNVSYKVLFVVVALIATIIPDVDSPGSKIGRLFPAKVLRLFTKHRGILHSLTFIAVISLIFALIVPVIALPFFAGYCSHLILDSFTIEGIVPFWPYNRTVSWHIRTGGKREWIFLGVVIALIILALIAGF